MATTTAAQVNGRTADEWAALAAEYDQQARDCYQRSAESFDRCDTDGFLSQWASDTTAREYQSKARWARECGYTNMTVLLNLDGTIASTMHREGQYGMYWVLNDDAAARFGKRFLNLSQASTYARKRAANARKGFRLGTARVPAHAPKLRGSNALSLSAYAEPQWDRVRAGEIGIVDGDLLATLQARDEGTEVV